MFRQGLTMFRQGYIIDTVHDFALIPKDVMEEIQEMWRDNSYHNDTCYIDMVWDMYDYRNSSVDIRAEYSYPKLMEWLDTLFPVIDEKSHILIRHWW